MVRIYDNRRDGSGGNGWEWKLNRPVAVNSSDRVTSVRAFLSGLDVYPTFVLPVVGPAFVTMNSTRRDDRFQRHTWETVTVSFLGLGSILVGGLVSPHGRGSQMIASSHLDPEALTTAAGLKVDRPDWFEVNHVEREASFHVRRLEHALHGTLVALYLDKPDAVGGSHPILADYCQRWACHDRIPYRRSDGLDLLDPGTWHF